MSGMDGMRPDFPWGASGEEFEDYRCRRGIERHSRIADRLNDLQRAGAEELWQRRKERGLNADLDCSPLALVGAELEAGDLFEAERWLTEAERLVADTTALTKRLAGTKAAGAKRTSDAVPRRNNVRKLYAVQVHEQGLRGAIGRTEKALEEQCKAEHKKDCECCHKGLTSRVKRAIHRYNPAPTLQQ